MFLNLFVYFVWPALKPAQGCGGSDGDTVTMGFKEQLDIALVVAHVRGVTVSASAPSAWAPSAWAPLGAQSAVEDPARRSPGIGCGMHAFNFLGVLESV